jgi:hypothetical protein
MPSAATPNTQSIVLGSISPRENELLAVLRGLIQLVVRRSSMWINCQC